MNYSLILESLLYYSPRFRDILKKMRDPIAINILNMEGQTIDPDVTFIDIDEDGVVTFSQMDKAIGKIDDLLGYETNLDSDFNRDNADDIYHNEYSDKLIYTPNRNQIKVGKLVKKIFGNRYNDAQIEKFVNLLKASVNSKPQFDIWSGDKMYDAYNTQYYMDTRKGSLGSSCMNDTGYIALYAKNPEVCRVLVLKDVDKIIGRALVWKLHSCRKERGLISNRLLTISKNSNIQVEYFMDRIYTSDYYLENNFKKYADQQGWAYRTVNGFSDKGYITYKGEDIKVSMSVKLQVADFVVYPYVDTFTRLDVKSKMMYNDNDGYNKIGHILSSTGGGYSSKNYPKSNIVRKFKDFFS
jgi:hypothetical protein